MKILFLDAYFEPEQIAFTHLEHDLLERLVENGHEIYVICPCPTRGISNEIAKEYQKKRCEDLFNGHVHVIRFFAPREGKNVLMRALRYFWCNIRTYQLGREMTGVNIIFSNSTPPTQGWIAGKVADYLGVPFVYSLQDIFPDSLVNAGMTNKNSILWKIGSIIENVTYENATKIITISNDFFENLISKGIDRKKIIVIPNWIDISKVFPIDREKNIIRKKYRLDSYKFYASYSGNIGHSQNIELLVRAAVILQEMHEEIGFIIIGDGVAKEILEMQIKKNNLKNICMLPFQPYEDIAHVFSVGDVGLLLSKAGIGGSSIPSKTWSIMAAARPVVAAFDLNSSLSKMLVETKSGIVIDPADIDGFVKTLIKMAHDNKEVNALGKNGRNYVTREMNKELGTEGYIRTIEKCYFDNTCGNL